MLQLLLLIIKGKVTFCTCNCNAWWTWVSRHSALRWNELHLFR